MKDRVFKEIIDRMNTIRDGARRQIDSEVRVDIRDRVEDAVSSNRIRILTIERYIAIIDQIHREYS